MESVVDLQKKYTEAEPQMWGIEFPMTAVEVHNVVAGTPIQFGPRSTLVGPFHVQNCFFREVEVVVFYMDTI